MKKLMCFITVLLLTLFSPATTIHAGKAPVSSNAAEAAEIKALLLRIDEINAMDKVGMTSAEKKLLRKEVRATKKRVHDSGGVYVSVSGLIIILLLLIILI